MRDDARLRSAGEPATTAAATAAADAGPAAADTASSPAAASGSPGPLSPSRSPAEPPLPDTGGSPPEHVEVELDGPVPPPLAPRKTRNARPETAEAAGPAGPEAPPEADKDAPETRRKVYATLLAVPGLNLSALARTAGVGESLTRYHLGMLMRAELAREDRDAGHARYFPAVSGPLGPTETVDRRDKALIALLRRAGPLRMVLELQVRPGHRATMGDLARAAGVSPGTATYHVGKLRKLGAIDTLEDGRLRIVVLVEPERIRGLLGKFPPPRDLVQSFTDLWDQVQG